MTEPRPVVIHTGFQTAFRLRGVPETSLTPTGFTDASDAALTEVKEASATVKLKGTVKNLPEACTCKVRWVINTEGGGVRRVMIGEKLPLGVSGEEFSLELTLDVFALELFGQGTVTVEIQPEFPLCEPARMPNTRALAFDNAATFAIVGGIDDLLVGAKRSFKPTTTGVLSGADVRLVLHESGDDATRSPRVFLWSGSDRAEKPWVVGCAVSGDTVRLDYQGPIEYGYTLEVRPSGGAWVTVGRAGTFATAPRPALTSLELVTREGEGGTGYWLHQVFTRKQNERRDVAFFLTGRVTNLAKDAYLPLRVALWVETGQEKRWFRPSLAQSSFTAKPGETFEIMLADFTEMETHLDLTNESGQWTFHAALVSDLAGDRLLTDVVDIDGEIEPLAQDLAASRPGMRGGVSLALSDAVEGTRGGDPSVACSAPAAQLEFHRKYSGGVRWRLTAGGLDIEGAGVERTDGEPDTVKELWEKHHVAINHWAKDFEVPVELIMATMCTESGGEAESKREEPGWVSDDATPCRVSAGLMHTLISSARSVLKTEAGVPDDLDEPVDCQYTGGNAHKHGGPTTVTRAWLFEPYNSIMAGTAFIKGQKDETAFDPVLVACAYNAGSLRQNDHADNRWRIAQYPANSSAHADRFVKWFNDFWTVIADHAIRPSYSLRESFGEAQVVFEAADNYMTPNLAAADKIFGKKYNSQIGVGRPGGGFGGGPYATNADYYSAVDTLLGTFSKVSDSQKSLLGMARQAADDAAYFEKVKAHASTAAIDWGSAMLTNADANFDPTLKKRMEKYHVFLCAAKLYSTLNPAPGGESALRNGATAHKWSTEHYLLYPGNRKSTLIDNLITMFGDATYHSGSDIVDLDGNKWASKSDFVDASNNAVTNASDIDREKTYAKVKTYVNTLNYRNNKNKVASEGYLGSSTKRLPNASNVYVSPHCSGDALDFHSNPMKNRDDPIFDYVAWQFGVIRRAPDEQWHFERTRKPVAADES